MTAAQPVATKRERAKAATKQGAKKSVETSTLLAFAVPIVAQVINASPESINDIIAKASTGEYVAAALATSAVLLSRIPWVLRYFGWERTATAFEAARAPDSPGGEDVTVGEMVDIGEAAAMDAGMREARGDQTGEDD